MVPSFVRAEQRVALLMLVSLVLACSAPAAPAPTSTERAASAPASAAGSAAAPTDRPLARLRYGQPSTAMQYLYLTVAQEQGFYREQGLDVELVVAPANVVAAALTAGELQFTAGIPGGIRLALRGLPLKVVSVAALQDFTLIARPEIASPEALRGKPVAISSPGATSERAMRAALRHLGVDPATVTLVSIGDPARQFQSLQAGAVEAAPLPLPYNILAEREGLRAWLRTDALYRSVNTGLVAPQARIDGQRDEVLRVIRAERAAVRFLKTRGEVGVPLVAERFGLAPDDAAAVYAGMLDGYPEIDDLDGLRDAIEDVIAAEREAGEITGGKGWAELVDPSLAREAAR